MIDTNDQEQVLRLLMASVFTSVIIARGAAADAQAVAKYTVYLADELILAASQPPRGSGV